MSKHSPAAIVAALREQGIVCDEHNLGLAAHADDPVAYARALLKLAPAPCAPHALPAARPICHGYANCCSCPDCARRARLGPPRAPPPVHQPWEPRPSRR